MMHNHVVSVSCRISIIYREYRLLYNLPLSLPLPLRLLKQDKLSSVEESYSKIIRLPKRDFYTLTFHQERLTKENLDAAYRRRSLKFHPSVLNDLKNEF